MIDLVWRWIVVAPADVLAALVAISLYWIPGLVGFRAASFAYRYAAVRHAAKLDQTQPIPAVIATIVFFYILLVMGWHRINCHHLSNGQSICPSVLQSPLPELLSNDTKSDPASSRCFRDAAKASTGLRREQESSISRRRSRAAAAKPWPNRPPEQRDKSWQARERA